MADEETTMEPRTVVAGFKVTEEEKTALRVVSGLRGISESELLRTTLIADVLAEFRRIRETADRAA